MDLNEQNNEIRKKLLNLPKLKASENFLNDIYYKINKIDVKEAEAFHPGKKKGLLSWFLRNPLTGNRNPWMIPAIGFTVILFLVFSVVFVINKNSNQINISPVTKIQESNTPPPSGMTNSEQPTIKSETEGKEITEDLKQSETRSKESENKYYDRGNFKNEGDVITSPEMKTGEVEQKVIDAEKPSIKGLEKNGLMEQDKVSDERKAESKGVEEKKAGKMDKEKKDAKTEKNKTKDTTKNKENEAVDIKSQVQESNEIDKNALENLKENIEKEEKK